MARLSMMDHHLLNSKKVMANIIDIFSLDEDSVSVVQLSYKMYLVGSEMDFIAKDLTSRGYQTPACLKIIKMRKWFGMVQMAWLF